MGNCCDNLNSKSKDDSLVDCLKRIHHNRNKSDVVSTRANSNYSIIYYDAEMFIKVMRIRKANKLPEQVQRHLNLALYKKLHPNAKMDIIETKDFEKLNFIDPKEVLSADLWDILLFDWECKQGYHIDPESLSRCFTYRK